MQRETLRWAKFVMLHTERKSQSYHCRHLQCSRIWKTWKSHTLLSWKQGQDVAPKYQQRSIRLHSVTSHKTITFIITTMKTSIVHNDVYKNHYCIPSWYSPFHLTHSYFFRSDFLFEIIYTEFIKSITIYPKRYAVLAYNSYLLPSTIS
jgi:hypothetical protein